MPPKEHLAIAGDIWGFDRFGEGGHLMGRACLQRTDAQTKNLHAQNVNRGKAEKPLGRAGKPGTSVYLAVCCDGDLWVSPGGGWWEGRPRGGWHSEERVPAAPS